MRMIGVSTLLLTSSLGLVLGQSQTVDKKPDWWSLNPLLKPQVPLTPQTGLQIGNPIDAFITAGLGEKGLSQAPEATRRTLIRRLSFNLTGLPPTPQEVESFVNDPDPKAYMNLVERLLASPRYGERWARHWLDVVHYGDTHGYDKDQPRPNAWPYRDYVIRALNSDKPYAQFIREQIAGDALYPGTVDGVEALGFLSAGPWDLIGHTEVPETKTDGKIARHLDRDDMVQNAVGTLCSLTVQCAQCHNHKFDPIRQEDYYQLQAVFAGVDRANKEYFPDGTVSRQYAELKWKQRQFTERKNALTFEAAKLAGEELQTLDKAIGDAVKRTTGGTSVQYGYHSALSPRQDSEKWVQVDLGLHVALDRVLIAPCHDDFNRIGAGFGFPVRFRIEVSDDPTFLANVVSITEPLNEDFARPGVEPLMFPAAGKSGRYVRFTAVKLAPRSNDFNLALAELAVLDASGKNLALGAAVTSLDTIEAAPRWSRKNLVDGEYPGRGQVQGAVPLTTLQSQREVLLQRVLPPAKKEELLTTTRELADRAKELEKFPTPKLIYAATVHFGSGNFTGTGPSGGKPRLIHLLKRGDVKTPGKLVAPGSIQAIAQIAGLPQLFAETSPDDESARRAALALWVTDAKNPLTWRSITNRVWQYHFDRALADTPNDFGRMGEIPSHPELLDWLAATFRDDLNGSLKDLHRLIVTSHTYRQSSDPGPIPAGSQGPAPRFEDVDNRLLWRQNRRKLDAECLHDSVLMAAGKLNLAMGGPGYQDFVITQPAHSPHYEYHLFDPDNAVAHRRSIYRFIVRSQQQPFLTSLDCADPSMRVDKRSESISALQALALMNNGFMVTMARHLAEHAAAEAPGDPTASVKRAFELALSRSPDGGELKDLTAFATTNGLANACRLILNLNEFAFAD